MSAGELYLGLDVGTQGTKALLVDVDRGEIVARASEAYGLIAGLPAGAMEQKPATWIEAVSRCLERLLAEATLRARVAGIGVSGQQHGLVLLDEDGRVLRAAKLWCDTSTSEEALELSRTLSRAIPTGFTASKILWTKRHEPETWKRARTVFLPHDYVNFHLTGVRASEPGDASGTGYFDPVLRRFDVAAMRAIDADLEARVPPLVASDAAIGTLRPEIARATGLDARVLVSSGSGDNMMSALGSGATRSGIAVASLGTSATVFVRSERPLNDRDGLIAPFCDATGAWLPLLCTMNATGVANEVCRAFGATHDELEREAEAIEAGCDGLLWLPYLQGERVPDLPRASGLLSGMRSGALDRGRLYRAAIEGVALNLAWGVERMRALGLAIDSMRVAGGASKSRLWRRVLADVLGLEVTALAEPESAALGAAVHAAWCTRRARGERVTADEVASRCVRTHDHPIEPDRDRHARYVEALARFRELVRAVYGPT